MSTQNIFTKILIEATEEAAISPTIALGQDLSSFTIVGNGFAGIEVGTVQIYDAGQEAWYDYKPSGTAVALTSTINAISIDKWGQFRINKSITAAAVAITSIQFNNSTQS